MRIILHTSRGSPEQMLSATYLPVNSLESGPVAVRIPLNRGSGLFFFGRSILSIPSLSRAFSCCITSMVHPFLRLL